MNLELDYDPFVGPLHACGPRLVELIEDLLKQKEIDVHSVRHRVKTKESTQRKISSAARPYEDLNDMHDLLGLRVVTYFSDTVDLVGKLIRAEFDLDQTRSADKSELLDPDRFGYLSQHFVGRVSASRVTLPEWSRYSDVRFEIQVRSILQHSWAEIEHDLGYKSPTAIPSKIRRRFSRLAGVLELADDEFKAIRNALESHAKSADASVKAGRAVSIDQDSVISLLTQSALIRQLDNEIASRLGRKLEQRVLQGYAARRARQLVEAGFTSTNQMLDALKVDGEKIVEFAVRWMERPDKSHRDPMGDAPRGVSVFYLALHAETAKGLDVTKVPFLNGETSPGSDYEIFVNLHTSIFGPTLSE